MSVSSKFEKKDEAIGHGEANKLGKDLYDAVMVGNVNIFDESNLSDEQFFRKSCEENNIIHIAVRYEKTEFVEAFLEKYFLNNNNNNNKLITERNSQGNTPLHIAAEVGNLHIVELLYDYLKKSVENRDDENPWRAQNFKGNTALHVALIYDNFNVAKFLLEQDLGFARIVNQLREAPLHLAITHCVDNVSFEYGPEYAASHGDLIKLLLEKASCVASWPDAKGLTPLHRAASLNPPCNLQTTKSIIRLCPQSTLVCDVTGKSILHHLTNKIFGNTEIKDLFGLREIYILRNHQDQEGNTPLHTAAKCNNICMVKVLMDSSAKRHIKNRDGISAMSMIQQQDLLQPLQRRSMTGEERSSAYKREISFLLNRMHTYGINFLASQDSKGKNVLHILMKITEEPHCQFLTFIKEALDICPQLVCQTDQIGNTPIHILVQNKDIFSKSSSKILEICTKSIKKIKDEGFHNIEAQYYLPWAVQNKDGNTPLHEAIIAKNKELMLELLSCGKDSARLVNKRKETPLHLLAGNSTGVKEFKVNDIMEMVKANFEALRLPDKDGLTPISRALEAENLHMVVTLLRSVQKFGDTDDRTFWHILLKHPSNNFVNGLLQNRAFRKMLEQKDKDGNTPLHLAMKEKRFGFVEEILETCGRKRELSEGDQSQSNQWLIDLLRIPDNDGLTPIIRALKADNLDLATKLCCVSPEATEMGDTDGKTFWHLLLKHPSYNSVNINDFLQNKALIKVLEQKDKDGDTPLHLAMKEKRFGFVEKILETCGSQHELSEGNHWLMDLLRIPNNVDETPENLLADLPTLPDKLEKRLLTDPRMRGIRSSWRIPRSQLQNYMNSMNVIAALQTTITFTAAFTVPGGLIQDIGTPILIRSIVFQVFMISDVIAMCLSMMVLICLLWMVATNKRESVMIQDFALSLLLASFVATLLAFMTGVHATISPVKPWIAITTLVLCSLLMLLFHRFMLTKLLLLFKYRKVRFVKNKISRPADNSNRQDTMSCSGCLNRYAYDSSNSAS